MAVGEEPQDVRIPGIPAWALTHTHSTGKATACEPGALTLERVNGKCQSVTAAGTRAGHSTVAGAKAALRRAAHSRPDTPSYSSCTSPRR